MSDIPNTTFKVKLICENKSYCTLSPDPNVYGNNCIGVNKYLEVKYFCDPKKRNNERPMGYRG